MGYFHEVKDVFMKGLDLAGDKFKEGAETVADFAKDGAHSVQLRKDLFMKQRVYHNAVADVGSIVMDLHKENKDILTDTDFLEKVNEADIIEEECRRIEKELKESEEKKPVMTK